MTAPLDLNIGGIGIGPGHPCYIIAEAGVNHNGSLASAFALVDVAARSGANAVKFQTFRADQLATPAAPKAAYQLERTDPGESQWEMLRRLELTPAAHQELIAHCRSRNIQFLSAPFDEESADLLDQLGVPAFKIPSGEITNLPFLRHVARKRKPMLVSTGMAEMVEVAAAVQAIRQEQTRDIVVLQCTSNYPADPADLNLRAMATMAHALDLPTGYSDHALGLEAALAAVALGACVLEKHFTLDRRLPGPDQSASLEPVELAALVRGIRRVEAALGDGIKRPAASEAGTRAVARKSLVAAADLPAGAFLNSAMLVVRRPGTGISPSQLEEILGQRLRCAVPEGTVLQRSMLE